MTVKKLCIEVSHCGECPLCAKLRVPSKSIFRKHMCIYFTAKDGGNPMVIKDLNTIPQWCVLADATEEEKKHALIKEIIIG